MNYNPTLSSQDFSDVHNALCQLRSMKANLSQCTQHADQVNQLNNIIILFERGLAGAYRQELADFDRKSDYYSEIKDQRQFRSIWSMFAVDNLDQPHPFASTQLIYTAHWGAKSVEVPIQGPTWQDLWSAADSAIRLSGDSHHIFIENFQLNEQGQLELYTGS